MEKLPHRLDTVDYRARRIYHITMTTEGRRPLLGTVTGNPAVPAGHPDGPAVLPTPLGTEVLHCLQAIPLHHPHVRLLSWQLMPDHLHFILFITADGGPHLGRIILGFKQGCNKAYRRHFPSVGEAAILSQPPQPQPPQPQPPQPQPPQPQPPRPTTEQRKHGVLWAASYYETPLSGSGQLEHMVAYVHDNPRRLLLKRQHPAYFQRATLTIGSTTVEAFGNMALLAADRPRTVVRCSRRLTEAQQQAYCDTLLAQAADGAVFVSPFISPGEHRVMKAALEAGHAVVWVRDNGFAPYYKPVGRAFDRCTTGQLLMVSAYDYHTEAVALTRDRCNEMNLLAMHIVDMPLQKV